jgi:hypothetical protein
MILELEVDFIVFSIFKKGKTLRRLETFPLKFGNLMINNSGITDYFSGIIYLIICAHARVNKPV